MKDYACRTCGKGFDTSQEMIAHDCPNQHDHECDRSYFVRKRKTGEPKKINLVVDEGYVSCDMCACCYGASGDLDPCFCQIFSTRIDPEAFKDNRKRASSCTSYVPKWMERSMVFRPDVERWYEKDSMA